MILSEYKYAHPYYLEKCSELLGGLENATILKTDVWNEIRLEMPGSGAIAGALPNVGKTVCVEIMPDRAQKARERFDGKVEVVTGDIREYNLFPPGSFDAIICLSTINYMPLPEVEKVIENFHVWLKPSGRIYLVVWLTWEKAREAETWRPNEQFNHNINDFPRLLWETGFDVTEREEIFGSKATPVLVGYKCRAVPLGPGWVKIDKAQNIFGWMTRDELQWLAVQARSHDNIVELGSYQGRSTRALADNTAGKVTAIDHFNGPATVRMLPEERTNLYNCFCENHKDTIASGKVIPIMSNHKEIELDIEPDMVFIDGSHDYEDVKIDILKWMPKLKKGGLLCGHDARHFGVPQALKEIFGDGYKIADNTDIWYVPDDNHTGV